MMTDGSRTTLADNAARAYEEHATALIRLATILVGPSDAEDVVSAAVLRAFTAPQWATVENERAYLSRSVVNEARNFVRTAVRRRAREQRATDTHVGESGQVINPHPDVRQAVMDLSVRQRAVMFLAYWEDMTDSMIADSLGIGVGSVRRHRARARRKLKEVLHD